MTIILLFKSACSSQCHDPMGRISVVGPPEYQCLAFLDVTCKYDLECLEVDWLNSGLLIQDISNLWFPVLGHNNKSSAH